MGLGLIKGMGLYPVGLMACNKFQFGPGLSPFDREFNLTQIIIKMRNYFL